MALLSSSVFSIILLSFRHSRLQVFFYKGELHILPCPSKSSPVGISKDVAPSVAQALALLSTHPVACRASPKISSAVMQRLAGWEDVLTS